MYMKRNHFFLLVVLLTTFFTSCRIREDVGPYQEASQSYSLSGFTKIQMGSAFKVNVVQGTTFNAIARGDRRNLDDLQVRVEGGILKADYYPYNVNRKYTTEFTIIMPTLEGVDFSGAVTATVNGFIGNPNTYIRLSGASTATVNLQVTQCDINLSGASTLNIAGTVQNFIAEISGASTMVAFGFAANTVNLKASGASYARLQVNQTLTVEASGASIIRYIGNPSTVNSNLSGASTLSKE